MKIPTQIKTPENWQDFENLCKKLWGEIWSCPNTIKRNGRNGQNQCGVDIYGTPQESTEYYGIQCKGKDLYTHTQLTEKEIDSEIEKAKNFKPALKAFYFATTAVKDAKIEEYIRLKNVGNRNNGGFIIDVFSWEDIVDLLKENRNTYNWYINDCLYSDNTDIEVMFANKCSRTTISPKYYAISPQCWNIEDKTKINPIFNPISYSLSAIYQKNTRDESWCKVDVMVENIVNTTIDDYMISINFHSENDFYLDDDLGVKAHTGIISQIRSVHNPSEVFVNDVKKNLEFRPKSNKLIQNDNGAFSFWINAIDKIELVWEFKARNYNKIGELEINCKPIIEKKHKRDDIENTHKDNLIIEPQIIKLD